jgi:CRP-like cAMP-binding protein
MDLDLLRAVAILRELTDDELAAFASLLEVRQIPAGERVIEEGNPVTAFYIVCDGIMHVRRLAQGREILLGRLGVGSFFGEINLFDPGVATASIDSVKPSRLAVVEYDRLRNFMEINPVTGYKMVSAMMTEMARRLRETSTRLVNSVYWSVGEAAGMAR